MLTPQYLARAPDRIVNLYQKLEDFIIADLVRRLTTSVGKVATQTALHQLQQAQSWGLNIDKIQAEVARITGRSEAEIMALFDDAMREAVKYDNPIYEAAGMEPPDSESEQLDNFIKASRRRTGEELHNLTQSMGFAKRVGDRLIFQPIAQYYQNTLDFALMQAQSGELDVVSAIRKAVAEMAGGGLRAHKPHGCSGAAGGAVRNQGHRKGNFTDARRGDGCHHLGDLRPFRCTSHPPEMAGKAI